MAADLKPSTWLGAGYAVDDTNKLITFNTNDASTNKLLEQLTNAQANATTGDIRDVVFAFCEALNVAWQAQSANRTAKMVIKQQTIAQTDGTQKRIYTFTFVVTPPTGAFSLPSE